MTTEKEQSRAITEAMTSPGHYIGSWKEANVLYVSGNAVTKLSSCNNCFDTVALGNFQLYPEGVTTWTISLKEYNKDYSCFEVGVAAFDIGDQNDTLDGCYFNMWGELQDEVGGFKNKLTVICDATNRDLEVVLNGKSMGHKTFAFGKPCVPAVLLGGQDYVIIS